MLRSLHAAHLLDEVFLTVTPHVIDESAHEGVLKIFDFEAEGARLIAEGYAAADPQGAAQQALGQAALTGQAGAAVSGASQTQPTNTNVSVRILSPGDNGDVKQSNSAGSSRGRRRESSWGSPNQR